MRLEFKFRHTPHSDELTQYCEEHTHKLAKFERKPVKIEFTFTTQKQTCRVDISARGKGLEIHAHHESHSFSESVDQAIAKIGRQLERKKGARAHQRRTKPQLDLPVGHQNPEDAYSWSEDPTPPSDSQRKVS